jgi:hypothetical protein
MGDHVLRRLKERFSEAIGIPGSIAAHARSLERISLVAHSGAES